ncbi:hypothetical protein GCM10009840_17450 [Pseudolysinimonas kribbensis]|uniref:Uncharacterized protein n=1 Tax=Pseudolysinimonas kribbensis TaxID=433641 RepID=A0ABQ6K2T1_9MICO|nr:hypothetical protein GCM10025881_06990 [Pseudolysinimonas kribbensis]
MDDELTAHEPSRMSAGLHWFDLTVGKNPTLSAALAAIATTERNLMAEVRAIPNRFIADKQTRALPLKGHKRRVHGLSA